MGFLALILVGLAAWLIWTGRLQRMTMTDGIMLGLAIVGAMMAARGRPIIGGAPLALSALYAMRRFKRARVSEFRPGAAPSASENSAVRDARALLGLQPGADEEAIRVAHRRLIARTHPDAGGTQALAEKINEARDILLSHAGVKSRPHSEP